MKMKSEDIEGKINKFELFIEEKLKNDLKKVEDALRIKNKMYQEWEEVENMSKIVHEFREKDRDMHLKLELGAGVLIQGEVTEFNDVFVDIGLGHLLKMEPDEAIKYAGIRKRALNKEVEHYRKLAVDIKLVQRRSDNKMHSPVTTFPGMVRLELLKAVPVLNGYLEDSCNALLKS